MPTDTLSYILAYNESDKNQDTLYKPPKLLNADFLTYVESDL